MRQDLYQLANAKPNQKHPTCSLATSQVLPYADIKALAESWNHAPRPQEEREVSERPASQLDRGPHLEQERGRPAVMDSESQRRCQIGHHFSLSAALYHPHWVLNPEKYPCGQKVFSSSFCDFIQTRKSLFEGKINK